MSGALDSSLGANTRRPCLEYLMYNNSIVADNDICRISFKAAHPSESCHIHSVYNCFSYIYIYLVIYIYDLNTNYQ